MIGKGGYIRTIPVPDWVKAGIYASNLCVRRDWYFQEVPLPVAVGTAIAGRPPHRSVRAELPHTALTLDGWRQNERRDRDAGHGQGVTIARRSGEYASNWGGFADCDGPT